MLEETLCVMRHDLIYHGELDVFIIMIVLLMFAFPIASLFVELFVFKTNTGFLFLMGKWFVFWGVGVRLFTAGLRQALQPQFTAQDIFGIRDTKPLVIVRELGFANCSIGLIGLCSVFNATWILPSAIAGDLFYGLAVLQHLLKKDKNATEMTATISGLLMFIILSAYVVGVLWKS